MRIISDADLLRLINRHGLVKWADAIFHSNLDLIMLACWNSPERTELMWRSLIERVDPRLRFGGIREPEGSLMAIVEAIWVDEPANGDRH